MEAPVILEQLSAFFGGFGDIFGGLGDLFSGIFAVLEVIAGWNAAE
ncbi:MULTISPECIES: PorACj family cell wall channel-forming small protein [Corynebacterium]|nr:MULTISPECIES: PorACj family cell wall channel-forming small protein [Corynebacterium]MBF0581815.1 PorACj family cell wall channel-forming small protein [Corynebacterium sp. ED61]